MNSMLDARSNLWVCGSSASSTPGRCRSEESFLTSTLSDAIPGMILLSQKSPGVEDRLDARLDQAVLERTAPCDLLKARLASKYIDATVEISQLTFAVDSTTPTTSARRMLAVPVRVKREPARKVQATSCRSARPRHGE